MKKVISGKSEAGTKEPDAEPTAHPKGKVVILGDKPKAKKKARKVSPSSRMGGVKVESRRAATLRETAARGIKAKRK